MHRFTLLFCLISLGLVSSTCDFATEFCSRSGVCSFLTARDGLSNVIQIGDSIYNGFEYDTVSFNDFTLVHGDVQGRVAVRNNFYGLQGISVGDQLTETLEYSLIVGGNVIWEQTGEVYPLTENVFIGGSYSLPSNIVYRVTGNCSTPGCLNSAFDSLYTYWTQFSASLAAQSANVVVSFDQGIASLTCQSSQNIYYVSINAEDFNNIIGYSIGSGCDASAYWVFNIAGSGNVFFGGNPIDSSAHVIYNIATSGNIQVSAVVNGYIIAPNANIDMNGGLIVGQVVAGNFSNVVQVNRPPCVIPTTGSATGSVSGSATGNGDSTGDDSGNVGVSTGDDGNSGAGNSGGDSNSGSAATTGSAAAITTSSFSISDGTNNNEDPSSAQLFAPIFALVVSMAMMI